MIKGALTIASARYGARAVERRSPELAHLYESSFDHAWQFIRAKLEAVHISKPEFVVVRSLQARPSVSFVATKRAVIVHDQSMGWWANRWNKATTRLANDPQTCADIMMFGAAALLKSAQPLDAWLLYARAMSCHEHESPVVAAFRSWQEAEPAAPAHPSDELVDWLQVQWRPLATAVQEYFFIAHEVAHVALRSEEPRPTQFPRAVASHASAIYAALCESLPGELSDDLGRIAQTVSQSSQLAEELTCDLLAAEATIAWSENMGMPRGSGLVAAITAGLRSLRTLEAIRRTVTGGNWQPGPGIGDYEAGIRADFVSRVFAQPGDDAGDFEGMLNATVSSLFYDHVAVPQMALRKFLHPTEGATAAAAPVNLDDLPPDLEHRLEVHYLGHAG